MKWNDSLKSFFFPLLLVVHVLGEFDTGDSWMEGVVKIWLI